MTQKLQKSTEETIRQILIEVIKSGGKRATQDNAMEEEQEAPITNRISD